MANRQGRSRESGQSTVEFTLTMILVAAFMLFFFQLSMLMGFSSYVQYATFMAARAYLAAGPSAEDQQQRAQTVIQQMLKNPSNPGRDRLPTVAKGDATSGDGSTPGLSFDGNQFDPANRTYSWMQGVRYSYKGRVFIMPLGSSGTSSASNAASLPLVSETYLGREVSAQDCDSEMKKRGMYDNGC